MTTERRTIVYGASDDLIEIDGSFREEFTASYDQPTYVGLSNGVVLRVEYDDEGYWRVSPRAGSDKVQIVAARGDEEGDDWEGCPGYSDKAIVEGLVEWAVAGENWAH